MTVSIEEFRNDTDRVSQASADGPVFITQPGLRTLVVLDIDQYRDLKGEELKGSALLGRSPGVLDPLALPDARELEFDPSSTTIEQYRQVTGHLPNIVDMLGTPEGVGDFEFDPPRTVGSYNPNREVDLSN